MSCKEGGFINIHHKDERDLTAKLLSEVCHDVQAEPTLLTLTRKQMEHCTAVETNEASTFEQEDSLYRNSKCF